MGRVKMKKKSTFIDMTAMSDVTVLLLTFFMLTSTFLTKEPETVITPPSVAEEKVPETNMVQVLVSKDGKIWLTMKNDTSQDKSNEKIRMEVLDKAAELYNRNHSDKVSFTDKQKITFAKQNSFGVPMKYMGEWLNLAGDPATASKADDWLAGKLPGKPAGIPINWNKDRTNPNEFQMWISAMRQTSNDNLTQAMKEGKGVAIKADANTSFEVTHMVMDNLQTMLQNKFTLMTALKEPEKTKDSWQK